MPSPLLQSIGKNSFVCLCLCENGLIFFTRFFAFLTFLVEEPGKGFSAFTESIVDFVYQNVFQMIKSANVSINDFFLITNRI